MSVLASFLLPNMRLCWSYRFVGRALPGAKIPSFSLVVFSALVALTVCPVEGNSQPVGTISSVATGKDTAPVALPKQALPGSQWAELTPSQQQALKPLASTWHTISEPQKRKWLEISKNYPSLSPTGQATMRSRMNDWAALSPQQRTQARLNFAKAKELSRQLTPEEKQAKWQTYQALSAEEKQKLAARAAPKSLGAATAVKPVPAQKLAALPFSANKTVIPKAPLKALPSSLPSSNTNAAQLPTAESTPLH